MSIDQERFADGIRAAGAQLAMSERELARADAEEKRQFAKLQFFAEHNHGAKTGTAQQRYADSTDEMFDVRTARGAAKATVAAARANLLAAEVEFKTWQSQQALLREERRVYGA